MVPLPVTAQRPNRDVYPNFEGNWNSATATPLERPAALQDKPFFTTAEAAQWEREFAQRNAEPPSDAAAPRTNTGTGTYNTFYREFGTSTVKTRRTSIITEPADGRIPALTPAAAEVKRRRLEGLKKFENPEELGLQDQCLAFLTAGPPTLVFDEVDAGIGGSAALAVGRSLGALGATHQVLVVTHLPQVAAFADHHVVVTKHDDGERTVSEATALSDKERVVELSRMLSGSDSAAAKKHARELLVSAQVARGTRS